MTQQENDDALNIQLDAHIARVGWAVMTAAPPPGSDGPLVFYTIGLSAMGWPEIVCTLGMPVEVFHQMASKVIELWRNNKDIPIIGIDTRLATLECGEDARVCLMEIVADEIFCAHIVPYAHDRRNPEQPFRVVQMVIPDKTNTLPTDEGKLINPYSGEPQYLFIPKQD